MNQEKLMEYQHLTKQVNHLQQHLTQMEKHLIDLERMKDSLSYISSVSEGQELLVPLGSGVFFKSIKSKDAQIIMSVGSDVCVEKDIPDTVSVVDTQIDELRNALTQIQTNLSYLMNKHNELKSHLSCECGDECGCGSEGCHC